jgi:hypothetical protein
LRIADDIDRQVRREPRRQALEEIACPVETGQQDNLWGAVSHRQKLPGPGKGM